MESAYPNVTRVTIVSEQGVEFERYNLYGNGVTVVLQDGGRTLKVFPILDGKENK